MKLVVALLLLLVAPALASAEEGPDATRSSPEWMPSQQQMAPQPAWMPSSQPVLEPRVERDQPSGRRWGVFSAGLSVWAVAYASEVGLSYGLGHADPGVSLIPVVGPLVQLRDKYTIASASSVQTGVASVDQQASQTISAGNQAYQSLVYTGLVLDAAVQLAGVITTIAGAATHKKVPARLMSSNAHGLTVRF